MTIDDDLAQQGDAMEGGYVAVVQASLSTEDLAAMEEVVLAAEEQRKAARDQALQIVSANLSGMRSEAIRQRSSSGIEDEWLEDEEAYEGIDDANRAEEAVYRAKKPLTGGQIVIRQADDDQLRSTVFMNITRPFTDAASARVSDMLQPTDDRAWQFKKTPLPDFQEEGEAEPEMQPAMPMRGMQPPMPGMQPPQQQGGQMPPPQGQEQAPPAPQTPEQIRQHEEAERTKRVERGQEQVDDWLIEANYHGSVRSAFDDSARIGTGIIKAPFPTMRRRVKWAEDGTMIERFEIVPGCDRVDPWDLFPDWPACGEDIHRGSFVFERARISRRSLTELKADPSYFKDQIEEALREGPAQYVAAGRIDPDPADMADGSSKPFEQWIHYGFLDRDALVSLGVDVPDGETPLIPILAVMVNDRVIKLVRNPLDTGAFPYSMMPWTKRRGMPWGRGVPRLVRTPQRQVNAATRNLMDNAGVAAGLILMLKKRGITPVDGNWNLHGRKIFTVDEAESATQAARDAIAAVEVPIRTKELMAIIDYALMMAERVTGMPLLLQGQQGSAPDTVGGMTMLNNNASTVMRRVAKAFDDNVTEPLVRRMYDWLQQYTDDPAMRFDAVIDARGSSALVERDMQNQWIGQMGQFVQNPAFRIDPAKWFAEFSKSVRFDPNRIQYSDEEWEKLQAQQQPQPPYQVQVAQIREQGQNEREAARQAFERGRITAELEAAREREMMKLVGDENLSTQEIKTRILEIMSKDRRERDIFAGQMAAKRAFGTSVDMPG